MSDSKNTAEPSLRDRGMLCGWCWWQEGERCFNKALGPIPMRNDGFTRLGHFIDTDHAAFCKTRKGFQQ